MVFLKGGTYGGNALGCAASCATIDVIEKEKILENATEQGSFLKVIESVKILVKIVLSTLIIFEYVICVKSKRYNLL